MKCTYLFNKIHVPINPNITYKGETQANEFDRRAHKATNC